MLPGKGCLGRAVGKMYARARSRQGVCSQNIWAVPREEGKQLLKDSLESSQGPASACCRVRAVSTAVLGALCLPSVFGGASGTVAGEKRFQSRFSHLPMRPFLFPSDLWGLPLETALIPVHCHHCLSPISRVAVLSLGSPDAECCRLASYRLQSVDPRPRPQPFPG